VSDFPAAPYMQWSKSRPSPQFDLGASSVAACTVSDLPGWRDAIELTGPNENGYEPLLEAIAARYGVGVDQVATANGASGANLLAFIALVRPGDDVLVERPAYDPLLALAALRGANLRRFDRPPEQRFQLSLPVVHAALTPKTRLIVLTSPHNPTGATLLDADMRMLGEMAAEVGAYVLVDEVYLDIGPLPRRTPAACLGERFVSTSSLTKSYGLAGLRCGWCLASPEVTERLRRARDVVDAVGAFPAERLGALAFRHLDALEARARAIVEPNLARAREVLMDRRELAWLEPEAGTVAFPRVRGAASSDALAAHLVAREKTMIVPGRFFEMPKHFRIGLGVKPDVLEGGLAAICRALDAGAHKA